MTTTKSNKTLTIPDKALSLLFIVNYFTYTKHFLGKWWQWTPLNPHPPLVVTITMTLFCHRNHIFSPYNYSQVYTCFSFLKSYKYCELWNDKLIFGVWSLKVELLKFMEM